MKSLTNTKSQHAFATRALENQEFSTYQPVSKDGNWYNNVIVLLFVIIGLSLFSCGKKGDLYLEGEEKQVKNSEEL